MPQIRNANFVEQALGEVVQLRRAVIASKAKMCSGVHIKAVPDKITLSVLPNIGLIAQIVEKLEG